MPKILTTIKFQVSTSSSNSGIIAIHGHCDCMLLIFVSPPGPVKTNVQSPLMIYKYNFFFSFFLGLVSYTVDLEFTISPSNKLLWEKEVLNGKAVNTLFTIRM